MAGWLIIDNDRTQNEHKNGILKTDLYYVQDLHDMAEFSIQRGSRTHDNRKKVPAQRSQ
jgi:hypothetical protein